MQAKSQKQIKDELQYIISGIGRKEPESLIETATSYLRAGKATNKQTETTEFPKQEEAKALEPFAHQNSLWVNKPANVYYLAEGAEQKVYLKQDGNAVLKFNDAIFYVCWEDYFISLTPHNYFFPETAYTLIGFHKEDDRLFAVVQQAFVIVQAATNLTTIKQFLLNNGFTHKKNNDYFNECLGIILENLHDENVLTNTG